ncbi:group 1 glycosyl transferase [Candidatus Thiomargarita nelsonii]|uniref:Group 1 glycosyl transferase n=1 Tax=Candidatus Thiomargarita nelsonii TaxID=1003181 RepID=A0A176RTT9_9GAMM|nr:group 1 glycosyl transferase [Candidatus Thiomargarita nelsonii]
MMIKKTEISNFIRAKRLFKHKIKPISVTNIRAITYRDVLELYLYISGQRDYQWKDSTGEILPRQSIIKTVINLIKDLLAWFFLYWFHARKTTLLKKLCKPQETFEQKFNSILFLRTDHWFNIKSGGSVGHLSGVINGFRTFGKQVQVVSSDYLVNVEKEDNFQICKPTYELGRNLPNVPELIYNKQLIQCLESKFENNYPSFIYQRYSLGNYVGVYLKAKYKIPYVCEYNGSFPWMAKHWGGKKLFHDRLISKIELLNLNAADVVVVVSQPMKNELVDRGIEANKILVNPNGVDPARYSPDVNGSQIRKQYGFDEDKILIGFIGTFGLWHGAEVLAEAFGKLLQKFPDYQQRIKLLMIGDGPRLARVKENIEKYGVGDACIMTGLISQEDGPIHLAACDILASPHVPNPDGTPFFGSPTKLFEYMAMGKGIVASDLDQIGEILKHEQTAWMVKPGNSESLMSGLKTLIDNPKLRDKLGQTARKTVLQHQTWRKHTQKIIDKLKERCA